MYSRKIIVLAALAATGFCTYADSPATLSYSDITTEDVTGMPDMAMPAKWTFDDCIKWAVENSTSVRRSLLSILQADQETGSAKDAYLPTVNFSTSHSITNYPKHEVGRTSTTYGSSYGINASWTVWEGNVRKYRLESAKIMREQQELSGDDAIKELKLGILQAYLNIMYAREAVEIARQTLEVSTKQTERARRLMESGRTSKVDFSQIESQMAQDQYSLVQAEGNLNSSKIALKKLLMLGLDCDMEIADITFSDDDVTAILPPREQVYDFAASWLPSIKSNDLSQQIYTNDIKTAKAGYLPKLSLQGGIGTGYNSGGDGWSAQMGRAFNENVGLSLSIPIFDGNSTKRAVNKAKLASLEYDLNRTQLLDDLSHTIESLYIDATSAQARYIAGITQLEATQLSADFVNRQFELGMVNPVEFLIAHNNLANSRLEQLQNKFMAILANKTIMYYATTQVELP